MPVLQHIHKAGQKSTFIERHRPVLPIQRVLPLGSGIDLNQSIRTEPKTRKKTVILALLQPLIWAIWPAGFAPSLIATVLRKPEGIHHVVIEMNAELSQAGDLAQLFHGQLFR